ncbi:MAG: hypothetical protein ACYC0X_32390 [Pirellulaceae bacterium]
MMTPSVYRHAANFVIVGALAWAGMPPERAAGADRAPSLWTFACSENSDLYRVVVSSGFACPRFASPWDAVRAAPERSGVLILADGYPEHPTPIEAAVFELASDKRLRLYVEYAERLPDLVVGEPKEVTYERGVVTSEIFGDSLRPMRIVLVSGCRYLPVQVGQSHLVLAKVAGVDAAVFGLQDTPTSPLLFDHAQSDLLVATTKLSQFVGGRYLPGEAWCTIWQTLLARLHPEGLRPELRWMPVVRPSYGPAEPLPIDIAAQALRRSADWVIESRVLRHADWPQEALDRSLTYNTVRSRPSSDWPRGDGSHGVLEGLSSAIQHDGRQLMRYAVRNDCSTEVAMLLAFDGAINSRPENAQRAANLLEFIFDRSGLAGGPRADPTSPSFGLIGWALDSPGSYWGDDNARAILAVGAVAALTDERRWNEWLARCILANLRTTGVLGFREACVQEQSLQRAGWEAYWTGRHVQLSPHFQSWLWACNLWAYQQTRFEPLLTRSKAGLQSMMAGYPAQWQWCLRSGTMERSRLLLPLAWLVRVDDTPEHRQWLRTVATDLLAVQDASGALPETIGDGGVGIDSNAEFGTRETSLIQQNGDTVCDLLYSCNFALVGLHEAAAATGEPLYVQAADKLAQFLARIQIRSESHPELDGAWCRAFDFSRWEFWGSNADWEWGPWCVETGWAQPWIAGTLALRHRRTSLWDLLQTVDLKEHLELWQPRMIPDGVANP